MNGKKHRSKSVGHGGLACPCCNPMHDGKSRKAGKRFVNRHDRRAARQALKDAAR